jgi:hypothetical protein
MFNELRKSMERRKESAEVWISFANAAIQYGLQLLKDFLGFGKKPD